MYIHNSGLSVNLNRFCLKLSILLFEAVSQTKPLLYLNLTVTRNIRMKNRDRFKFNQFFSKDGIDEDYQSFQTVSDDVHKVSSLFLTLYKMDFDENTKHYHSLRIN